LWEDILKMKPERFRLVDIFHNLKEIGSLLDYPPIIEKPEDGPIAALHKDDINVFMEILKNIDYREDKTVTVLREEKMDGPIIMAGHEYIVEFLMTPKTGIYFKMMLKVKTSDRLKYARPDIWGDEDKIRFHYEMGGKTNPNYDVLHPTDGFDSVVDDLFSKIGRGGEKHGFTYKDIKIYTTPSLRFRQGAEKVTGQEGEERGNWWS
jgi:hypothetical protein|tara:strand:- start:191 stop:811 length:621 start_codon:yes stop_codon:yes gene_type:complete